MKKVSIILTTCLLLCITSNAQNSVEASEYMAKVTEKAFELDDETWKYLKAVTRNKKARKVEDKRKELVSAIKTAKLSIARKKDFYGNTQLRDAIVNYLELRYNVLKGDYDKILDMEEIAEQSYDNMEAYLLAQEKASEKLDSAFQIMSKAQKDFAEKYEIELTDSRDRIQERIRSASETLEYYNDVYLVFFKSYKQEAYVLDAIEREDVSSIEQNNSVLLTFAEEGMDDLQDIKSFKGDVSLVASARKALIFYRAESKKEFKTLSDYFLKKDEFDKINKRMQAMSKKERTQAEIDKYNKAVSEFNAVNDDFNKAMQSSYEDRTRVLEDWNKKAESFINNHSR